MNADKGRHANSVARSRSQVLFSVESLRFLSMPCFLGGPPAISVVGGGVLPEVLFT